MWTLIKAVQLVVPRRARAIVAIAALALMTATPSHAVEYVRICSLYGAGFFYIPGTDTCLNVNQMVQNTFDLAREATKTATGTAMATALVNPWLPDGTNYAISTHWAVFDGQHAVGFAGLMRLWGNMAFSAGVAVGLDRGKLLSLDSRTATEFGVSVPSQNWSTLRVLGRVGLQYSW